MRQVESAIGAVDTDSLTRWLQVATVIWIAGMVTLFPLGNDALDAVSFLTLDRIAFAVVGVLGAAYVFRNPGVLRQASRIEAVMAVYLAVVLISWATTLAGKDLLSVKRDVNLLLTSFLMPYTAFLIGRHVRWTNQQMVAACWVLAAAAGIFLVAVGLVQVLVDWRFLVSEAAQEVHRSRARGIFDNAFPYALVLTLLLYVALFLFQQEKRVRFRWMLVGLIAALIEGLILSKMRVVWLAVPVGLLFLATVCPAQRRVALWAALGMLAALSVGNIGFDISHFAGPSGALSQPEGSLAERTVEAGPLYNRVAVYATDLNMISHHPLFGFGFGGRTFETNKGDYYTSCCDVSPQWAVVCAVPHNEVLNHLVLLGAVGLVLYLLVLREIWRLLAQARRDGAQRQSGQLAVCLQAAFICLAISAQLHDLMYVSYPQVIFLFLTGLVAPAGPHG